ncbi:MAG: inorganic phosphate transporter [Pseudomonadales bacterium]|nr:inorganic phosphate transporter [Pseudomonadales bacterium]
MAIIAEYNQILLMLAVAFAFFMAWGVGANDVANAMATSVGSKAITIKHAIMIAVVFEFLGAYLAGGEVTGTIRKGIIDAAALEGKPEMLVFGMMSALLAAGTWLFIASQRGWPVSTTHSIVGAIVGFAAVGLGVEAVKWGKVGTIAASWIVSPLLAGTIAFLIYKSVRFLILDKEDVYKAAVKYIPVYMFLVGFMISMVTMVKGLKHIGLDLSFAQAIGFSLISGIIISGVGKFFIHKVDIFTNHGSQHHPVERIFAILMIFTACAMAFAHGSNDVANAVGPLAAIYNVLESGGEISATSTMPAWILLVGGAGIVLGLTTFGFKVMATVGNKITELTPSLGFAAELSAASTVVLASGIGLPVSTTHTLVGAVLGVGLAHNKDKLNWGVLRSIALSWVITIPVGAGLSIVFYYIIKTAFGA